MPDGGVQTPPQPPGGNYAVARLNALKHGVLSQFTVLPWEDGAEYQALLEALVAEHKPRGPTEEHLVEEVAGVFWRKRRLRLGESAVHHRALAKSAAASRETAKAALVHVASDVDGASVTDAITATEEQTAAELAELKSDQAIADEALRLLGNMSVDAYSRALAVLDDFTRDLWEDELLTVAAGKNDDENPYSADVTSLKRFLENEILPMRERQRRELDERPLIRAQAFGEAVDTRPLERLARYEVHLDRKLERTLTMLLRLQQLRSADSPR